jgi:hypothetical protein
LVNAFETFPHLISPLKIGNVNIPKQNVASPVNSAEIVIDGQPSLEAVGIMRERLWAGLRQSHTVRFDVDPEDYREGRYLVRSPGPVITTTPVGKRRRRQGAVSV